MTRSDSSDSYRMLKELLTMTSPFIGEEFFRRATAAFGRVLAADWVFVARVLDAEKTRVRVLGAWKDGADMDGWDFALAGTPCSMIYDSASVEAGPVRACPGSQVHVSRKMCDLFPAARGSGFQSFLGLPLWSRDGVMVGHVAVFFHAPMEDQARADSMLEILQLLAHRAEAELDRLLLEEERNHALLALEEMNQRLYKESMTDPLTGLYNRRYFVQRCDEAHVQSLRTGKPYCVLLVDIDLFKTVNDTHGHDFGDQVLRAVALTLLDQVRAGVDIVARLGGEEFGVLCQEADALQALDIVGERLRLAVANLVIRHCGRSMQVSISVGIAESKPGHSGWEATYRRADAALYDAKSGGRNMVRIAPPGARPQ
ncbi:MAG: putative diguanylate cyclase [Paucimonas sp.]|nr:putative diguanylate cyclase [Paucimonas sp.]